MVDDTYSIKLTKKGEMRATQKQEPNLEDKEVIIEEKETKNKGKGEAK